MVQRLSSTRASGLDTFIRDHLLPNTDFRTKVNKDIRTISDFLMDNCFQVRVSKVVKGSSSGKDTKLRGRSDAELVVFVKNLTAEDISTTPESASPPTREAGENQESQHLTGFEDQLKQWGEFIKEIKKQLHNLRRERQVKLEFVIKSERWSNSLALNFRLSYPKLQQKMEFDVLFAYDVLGDVSTNGKPGPQIYKSLIEKCTSLGLEGEFSTCFAELQRNFLKDRPLKLKNLIRLVKHWYQLCKEKLRKLLPPQYALELLTVYAWESGSGDTEFITAQGFRTVLELVTQYRQLQIYWTTYYDFQDQDISKYLHSQLRRARPVILDPADPTRNVAGSNSAGWWLLAEEAVAWLDYSCVKDCDMSLVRSWAVSTF
uniref:2'-5'-oligoadenylate synthase 1A-like n=1 Tax=Myodes glareolus TaxID=447135 RepID=UPI0020206A56|nr:2'-5'-oligoadenylate synthase 1A-like [Myodes glareolus]